MSSVASCWLVYRKSWLFSGYCYRCRVDQRGSANSRPDSRKVPQGPSPQPPRGHAPQQMGSLRQAIPFQLVPAHPFRTSSEICGSSWPRSKHRLPPQWTTTAVNPHLHQPLPSTSLFSQVSTRGTQITPSHRGSWLTLKLSQKSGPTSL